jgi:hypothetical protein
MTGVKKAAIFGVWTATLIAVFLGTRLIALPDSASAPDDFGAAIRAALAEKDGLDRAVRTATILQHLDPENVAEATAVYDRLVHILDAQDVRPFAIAWARFDPAAALEHTLSWRFPDKRKAGARAAIEGWAMRDPAGALQAYDEARARVPSISEELLRSLLTGWLYSGEGGLVEYLTGLSSRKQETAVTRVVARLMYSGDADAAMRWVESIVQDDAYEMKFKKQVFRRGMRMLGRADPELTATWAMEHEGQPYATDAARIVAGRWGSRDGRAAMQWVRELPREEVPELAVREAFRTWMASDREGAVAWLESETLTAFHDPAIAYYANILANPDPEEAIVWCERLLDSASQLPCLKTAAAKWFQKDPAAAETWLQQSSLDEEARRAARTLPEKKKQQRRPRGPGQPMRGDPGVEVIPVPRTPQ